MTFTLNSENGCDVRPVGAHAWPVPDVIELGQERGEDCLYWRYTPPRFLFERPRAGMLDGFTRLWQAPNAQILRFARRWGALHICAHNLPTSHAKCMPLRCTRESGFWFWEPIETWRFYSRQTHALARLGSALHRDQLGADVDWQRFYQDVPDLPGEAPWWRRDLDDSLEVEKSSLKRQVDDWLEIGRVRARIAWWGATSRLDMGGNSLFGAIALQLALALSSTDGLAICSSCQAPYTPSRRPSSGTQQYCPDCRRRKVPGRDAVRAYRRRRQLSAPRD